MDKTTPFPLCGTGAFVVSITFCLVSSGLWQTGFWVLLPLLAVATVAWLYRTVTLWKHSEARTKLKLQNRI